MIEYIQFWASDNPFLLLFLGVASIVLLAVVHHVLYLKSISQTRDGIEINFARQRANYEGIVDLKDRQIKLHIENLDLNLKDKLATFDRYTQAWEQVRDIMNILSRRLVEHESANIMERSLVQSLKRDCETVSANINTYLMDGIDRDGSRRKLLAEQKTVKNGTDAEGAQDGQEEVSRIQSSNEVPQEHKRKS